MAWVLSWSVLALVGIIGVVVSLQSWRFARAVAHDAARLAEATTTTTTTATPDLGSLPAPVRDYLARALGDAAAPRRRIHLRQSGQFRTALDGEWLPLRAEQWLTAAPPGFVWWGRVRAMPGVWVDARDLSIAGRGSMKVALESTIALADSRGPELDQSATARLLGELAWLPEALADPRFVTWEPVDDHHARARLRVGDTRVEGVIELGDDGLPRTFTAQRYRDMGGGRSELAPFVGEYRDYRRVDGVLIPHEVIGGWEVGGIVKPFARFRVESADSGS